MASYGGAQAMYAMMRAKAEAAKADAANASKSVPAGNQDAASSSSASQSAAASEPTKRALSPMPSTLPEEGVVVIFGCTNYAEMGKRVGGIDSADVPNLYTPHRLIAGLGSAKIVKVATGSTSAHIVAIGAGGECFAWGRNDMGQLGVGDLLLRSEPTLVPRDKKGSPFAGKAVASASTGKSHTIFVTSEGELFASGSTKQGCVGSAFPKRAECVASPIPIAAGTSGNRFVAVSSGTNFNLAIDGQGDVWAWGWSEHGVLGNGTDGEFNKADGAVKLSYIAEPSPKRISALNGLKCIDAACGSHHCAAISSEGVVFTWGAGGYGRLGHKDQRDVWTPKPLEEIRGRKACCGAASTAVIGWPMLRSGVVYTAAPSLYMMGRVRAASQNAWMYPKTEDELRGWNLHTMDLGSSHNVVHADDAVITWGSGCSSGELGLVNPDGTWKKSSSAPSKCSALDGIKVAQVQCGIANTVLLVESSLAVGELPVFTPVKPHVDGEGGGGDEAEHKGTEAQGKRTSTAPAAGNGKKKKK